MSRRAMGSKRGSLPPKEGDLTCTSLYKPFISFLQKSAIFISNSRVSLKTVNCDRLQRSKNLKLVSFQRADTAAIF